MYSMLPIPFVLGCWASPGSWPVKDLKGSKYPRFEVSNPIMGMILELEARSLEYWVLGSSGAYLYATLEDRICKRSRCV